MRWKATALVLFVPFLSVLLAACGTSTSDLKVYSGYADNLNTVGARSAPSGFPNPWKGSSNAKFVGNGDKFDAGAVRVENTTGEQLTVEKVTVDVGSKHYDLWGSNLKVPANGSLVLTQTDMGTQNPPQPNFDSSEPSGAAAPGSGNATSQGADVVPVIHVTVNGHTTDYRDSGKVLNTGGVDKGDLAGAPNESHNWALLSAVGGTTSQGGLSPVLVFAPLAAMLLALLSWIPKLIGALLLLLAGWWIASALARLVMGLLGRTGAAAAMDRAGLFAFAGGANADGATAVAAAGRRRTSGAAWVFAQIVKWFVFLIFVSLAAEAIGLPQISALLHRIILWIPNLLVAVVILVLGVLLARFLAGLTRATVATARVGNPNVLGRLVEFAVIGLAAVVALTQIGVATMMIDILLVGLMLALALAFGLSFGLGGRSVTSQMWRSVTPSQARLTTATELPPEPTTTTTSTATTRPTTTRRR